ncbi:PREDICTED: uncharacterized protein LOC106723607 isoform X5 [Myotis brandtii]|uniref:uncharacterized protein LOC106723607 isoform X5 n=1 Tax=Myotis brandtii TaxID=109478 RepID=UPI000703D367|nr:PREDICTED: uncharacterized protein LOC106723607 isoform X5 [Myotis brandtii]
MTSLHLFLQNPSTGVCLPPPLETTASRDLGLGRAHRKHSTSAETKSLQGGMTCSRHLPMELASTQTSCSTPARVHLLTHRSQLCRRAFRGSPLPLGQRSQQEPLCTLQPEPSV